MPNSIKANFIFSDYREVREDVKNIQRVGHVYIWCVSKLGSNLWPQPKKKIFCGGHCVKSIYPREKVKYVPGQ